MPPTVPKVEITAKPIGPQLHAPADAPIIKPKNPCPIFFMLFCNAFILYTFMLTTNPDMIETPIINTNPISLSVGICIIKYGSKKIYSEIIESGMKILTDMITASAM